MNALPAIRVSPDGAWTTTAADALRRTGAARLRLPAAGRAAVQRLFGEMSHFFQRDEPTRRRNACPDFHFGYRPSGRQYSESPDRPDLNASFTYWSDDPGLVPNPDDVAPFLAALRDHWRIVAPISQALLQRIAAAYGVPAAPPIERQSYVETNWYGELQERDLLQDRHEDGHLLTLVTADAPGLEVEIDGRMQPVAFAPDDMLVMAGSLLTDMTGGEYPTLYHRVRNHRIAERRSALFLVNPPFTEEVRPFLVNDANRGLDIAARARMNGQMFGLPAAPVLDAPP